MILAIDAGNTHIVMGCVDDSIVVGKVIQFATDPDLSAYEYAVKMKAVMDLVEIDPRAFDGAVISSVVPSVTPILSKAVVLVTGHTPLVIGTGVRSGLRIELDDPGSVASDLVATAVAAKEEYPLPAIIIDMGTATSVTVVGKDGSYKGGCIMPGCRISLDALSQEASLLPSISFEPPKKVIGTNTADAMKGGIIFGAAGALDGVIDRFEKELGEVGSIIATGGMGRIVTPFCRHSITIDNRLLLKGLGYIWKNNLKTRPRRKNAQP